MGLTISFDTMIGAHVLNENLPVNLQEVGSRYLQVPNWGKGIISFGTKKTDTFAPGKPPTELWGSQGMSYYNCRDTAYTHRVFQKEVPLIRDNKGVYDLYRHLILPGINAILQMELNGIFIDRKRLEQREEDLKGQAKKLEEELLESIPEIFRDSVKNTAKKWYEKDAFIRKWFFGERPDGLGLKPLYLTDKTKVAKVDKKSLVAYRDHPVVSKYLDLNSINTLLKFFVQWRLYADEDDRLHPSFNLTGTVTGRRSCTNPNLQQVPRDPYIRSIIGAPPGWMFLEFDYSQIEVRLVAWFAEERVMLKVFADPKGDIYRYTAAKVMKISEAELAEALEKGEKWAKEARQKAKAMVLGFLYGMGAEHFGEYAYETYQVKFTSQECIDFRDEFFKTYPDLIKWHEQCKLTARKKSEMVSIFGRIRHLIAVLSDDFKVKGKAERQAINSPVQGTGGDLILLGIGTLNKIINHDEVKFVGDIHDALLVQVREDCWEKWATIILDNLENPPGLEKFNIIPPVKLKAEAKVGQYWGEGRDWRPIKVAA